ncbi:PaaI family thioesterase [Immundisolibacter sp.]|uniref:PaaI family thioesterase n=1 Tax=Immundisolibacter sp. TaxID=1934948 RepID=UPI00356594B9
MLYRYLEGSSERRRDYIAMVPHSAALGLQIVDVGLGRCVLRLPHWPALAANHGGLANGAVSALLDNAGGVAVFCALEVAVDFSTLSLRVEFITAPAAAMDVYARVECVRLAGRQAHVRGVADCGDANQPGQPFATVSGVFFLKPESKPLHNLETLANV